MDIDEKGIREREDAPAYVRSQIHKDRTALVVLLDRERAKSAAMLAALKVAADEVDWLEGPEARKLRRILSAAIASAEGR